MTEEGAHIRHILADTITLLVREGFTATSAAAFAVSGDPNDLVHTGAVSVQLFKNRLLPMQDIEDIIVKAFKKAQTKGRI